MSLNRSRIRTHRAVLFLVVFAAAAVSFGYFGGPAVRRVLAGRESAAPVKFAVPAVAPGTVNVETPRSPWIKLREGKAANSEFSGSPAAIARFEAGSLRPVSLTSADVNGDGFPDLISGFSGGDGGVVTIQRGAKQAFAPDDPQVLAGIRNGEFPASFEKDAFAADVPGSPDYLFTGRFLNDSTLSLAVATRGSSVIYIYPFNEKGTLGTPVSIDLGGNLTAAAADTFDPAKGFTGLVAATGAEGSASLVIFDGTGDVTATKGRTVAIAHPADSLILRSPDGLTPDKDLFILGGGSLSRLPAIGKAGSGIENIDLPFTAVDFAAGEFIRDRRARTELAVLADNGSIYYLANGPLDRRPFTEDEMRSAFAKDGRGRTVVVNSTDTASALANNWSIAEQQDLGLVNLVRPNAQPLLRRAYITGNETDDLLVVDPSTNHAKVLFKEPVYGPNRLAFTGDTQVEDLGFASGIAAALPIRLNIMGQQGIAVLEDGKLEATPVLFAPQATFTVTKTADTADGACNADCSLREAVIAANGAAGADLVTFSPNGSFQLTIGGAGENSASTGDIDVTQSLTISGNGVANTILQGGSTNANGIDKVLSINPTFTSAFATSITGVTVRFGRNPSSYATDGFGGGFDWEGSGTGTLSVANSTVNDNHTLDGDGGGITATNSVAGAGTFTVTNSTISNNSPARAGVVNSPVGGGIFVGTTTPYLITATTITGNFVTGSGGQGQGGGLFAFGPGGAGGNSFLTGSTVSSNTAPSDAGGVYTTQRVDINPTASITNNASGRFGGGLFINHLNATSTITKATITGNSATTTGGGIYLGTSTTANVLNISYSRVVGNTGAGFTGLATAGGTANATNNWWGCNTGPTAGPCDTAGAAGGSATTTPYLQLRNTAATSPILIGQTSALTASFLLNSTGSAISPSNLDVLIGLPVTWGATLGNISGSQATIQAAGTATATYTGTSAGPGTATATVDSGPAVANITVNTPTADLAITKTDGVTTATAGGSVTYTITASNAGPNGATGATVADTFPASLTGTWTCVGAGGGTCTASGSGNINDTVNLPAGGSVTYTVSASLSAAATGTLSNTATVAAPSGTTDPTPGNNSATDTDTIVRSADLAITKTDGVTSVTAGGSTTYTITASNAGPSNATGATVADTFPASLTATWTCVGAGGGTCTASGSGNINDTVNLPAGGSVTYTASASISASATGSLSNTATVAAPGGVTDPTPGNNSATDTDTIVPSADLAITKTDGVTTVTAGGSTTYTITASNAGPSGATGATVADTFPASLTGTWTCVGAGGGTCTASGSGNINDTVNLPSGGSVTYTVSATISAAATGTLSNTATVAAPGGVTDPTPGNNSATDTDTIAASADLAITKTDGVTNVNAGTATTYTITASNAGPSNASGSTVADTFAASITSATWTCVGAGGGTCTASGSGNINDTVNLPAGGSVTYTVTANVSAAATGTLVNTATVAAPAGVTDPTPGNNSATDTDTITPSDTVLPTAAATLTNVTGPGGTLYTFTVTYADNVAVNVSTLDNNDIVVTGPNAFTTPATFVSVDVNTNGTPRVATYSFVPPGGTWDQADNGTYTVTMQANQVSDTNGNFVNGGSLGTFTAVPLVLVVDRTDDTVVSACTAAANDCTLRGAIAAANAAPTADTINFDPTVFATPQTITLGGTEIVITNSGGLTVNGPGADKLTVSANGTSRVFTNSSGAVTTISGMRLTGGTGTGAAGTGRGGAVYNTGGTLTLNGLVVTGNTSTNGAALTNATAPATLNVVNCWIFGNATPGSGGAIQNFSGATVVTNVINSSITGNTANSSTVGGGAIQANGTVNVTNSTIGGNTAVSGSGGGIYFNGTALTVTNSTIAGNTSANNGGGIHNSTANPPNVRNSIIAGNNGTATSPDVTSVYASNGNNIIGNVGTSTGWVGTDLQNTDPLLAPLGFYGGNGYSFALTSASPAVNGGQDCVLTLTCTGPNPASAITLDMRGAARIGSVDIGAFELNNSANGGNFVALLPNALQGSAYNFLLVPVNGAFSQTVTSGSLPDNVLLNSGATATFSGTPNLSGVYPFSVTATGGANSNVTDYRLVVFAPPGTLVSVGGRVSVASGGGVKGLTVILTDSLNNSYYARTSPFGFYRIDNVPAGATYTLSQSSKRYQYTPTSLTVNYNIANADIVVTPAP